MLVQLLHRPVLPFLYSGQSVIRPGTGNTAEILSALVPIGQRCECHAPIFETKDCLSPDSRVNCLRRKYILLRAWAPVEGNKLIFWRGEWVLVIKIKNVYAKL